MAQADPQQELEAILEAVIDSAGSYCDRSASSKTKAYQERVLKLADHQQAALALMALERTPELRKIADDPAVEKKWRVREERLNRWNGALGLADSLLNRTLPWTEEQLTELLRSVLTPKGFMTHFSPYGGVVKQLEKTSAGLRGPEMAKLLKKLEEHFDGADRGAQRKLLERVRAVRGVEARLPIAPGEAWSEQAIQRIQELDGPALQAWRDLIIACSQSPGGAPTAKWMKLTEPSFKAIGKDAFSGAVREWFALVEKPRVVEMGRARYGPDPTNMIADVNMDILKGLAWLAGMVAEPEMARSLARLALTSYKKVAGIGPRAVRVGNAAVTALGQMPGRDALGQLALLRVKVKFGTAQKVIEKALGAAAEREGLPRDEVEELAVPSYGMGAIGVRVEEMGEYEAELIVTGIGDTELKFYKKDGEGKRGKAIKSAPAAVKASHGEDLKELKAAAKDIASMLPAQRDRIDSLFLEQKTWAMGVWRERYLDHPLAGVLARRLIWRVSDGKGERWRSVTWLSERFVGADGAEVKVDEASALVKLWHPIEVSRDEVRAWRRFFEDREIRQPFKQAHREVYLLTDAERNTGTYSNRFAAHVIKQHQFSALCGVRGWKNKLRLMVDDEYPPASRALRAWGLRAEYWIEGAGDEFGTHTNDSGVYTHLVTDQVRFYPLNAAQMTAHAGGGGYGHYNPTEGVRLETVPALVLSEVLRDVDLFVGVCSVGNNPEWNDGGPGGTHRAYWHSFSFGELSETGVGRKDILSRLLPRLKIAGVCELRDKFLMVRGKIRSYKIHLGSGNILMEPNDEYLCIVPRSGQDDGGVFLPFEGDRTLSVILSKALMLAEDDKIKDSSITGQIGKK